MPTYNNNLTESLQKLQPNKTLIHLYELEYSKGNFVYFHSGVNSELNNVQFRDYDNPSTIRTYIALPIKSDGFESKNDGAMPRPNVMLANINTTFSNAVGTLNYNDFLGLKFIRRTTFAENLHINNSSPNPAQEFPRQVWIMDRVKTRSKNHVQLELVSPFDLETVIIPARKVYADRCSFKYQGASPHLDRWKKAQSGCKWAIDGEHGDMTVHVNQDDEYIVPFGTSFATYTSGAITKDNYYKTTKTTTRFNANGTTSSVSINNYWQATNTNTSAGTASDSNSNFKRVRVYSTYNHGTEYFTYVDDNDNDYVVFTDNVATSETYNKALLWKATQPSQSEKPDYGQFWEKGDLCSKTTTGCKMRFGAKVGTGSLASVDNDTKVVLPFGGFPAARNFQ